MKQYLFKLYHNISLFKGFNITSKFIVMILTMGSGYALAIFPFVLYRSRFGHSNIITRTHQAIHIQQQMEVGSVAMLLYITVAIVLHSWVFALPILLLYHWISLVFLIRNLFIEEYGFTICWLITPFEVEANLHSNQFSYIGLRKPFAWIKYLRYCSNYS